MNAIDQPLNRIDPADAWKPWRPTATDPWGRKWAAHLYRRAAFGANREELIEAEQLGPDGTLDLLLHGRPEAVELAATLMDAATSPRRATTAARSFAAGGSIAFSRAAIRSARR